MIKDELMQYLSELKILLNCLRDDLEVIVTKLDKAGEDVGSSDSDIFQDDAKEKIRLIKRPKDKPIHKFLSTDRIVCNPTINRMTLDIRDSAYHWLVVTCPDCLRSGAKVATKIAAKQKLLALAKLYENA